MSSNVHGHKLPEPFRTNPDNPIFQRHEPEVAQPEIPQGLHGAPALRSELELPAEVPSPAGLPTADDLDAVAEEESTRQATEAAAEDEVTGADVEAVNRETEAIAGATVDPTDCSAGQSSTQTGDTLSQEIDTLTTAASQEAVTQSE